MKRNTLLICLICWLAVNFSYAYNEPFSTSVPSDQTMSQINSNAELPSTATMRTITTRDLDDGPPTEGGGTGGAVGMPVGDGIIPVALVGMAYLLFAVLNRKKKIQIQ